MVRQDADLEYDPSELINLVRVIDDDIADVVYGSRMLVRKAHRVHYFYSYIANKILTLFSNLMTNLFLSDVETAAKAFKGDIIRNINWTSKGFEIENEMTIKLKKNWMYFFMKFLTLTMVGLLVKGKKLDQLMVLKQCFTSSIIK